MTLPSYATRDDLIRFGLPAEALVTSPRTLVSVDPAGDGFVLEQHGLVAGDVLTFLGDELPAPLSPSTSYYALVVSPDVFKVSATLGGAAVNITSTGAAPIGVRVSNDAEIASALEERSRTVGAALTAHREPFAAPYPTRVVAWVARLAAADLVTKRGLANAAYRESVQPILDAAKGVWEELKPYRGGLPLDGLELVDATPGKGDNLCVGWGDDARGWDATDDAGRGCL